MAEAARVIRSLAASLLRQWYWPSDHCWNWFGRTGRKWHWACLQAHRRGCRCEELLHTGV